jgi:hypothetical protein
MKQDVLIRVDGMVGFWEKNILLSSFGQVGRKSPGLGDYNHHSTSN